MLQTPDNQFMRVERLWRFLAAQRESGQIFSIDSYAKFRPEGSFSEVCFTCPVPGFNTPPLSLPMYWEGLDCYVSHY